MDKNYNFFMKVNLEKHIGKWIAINNDNIIASGKNVKDVIKRAQEIAPRRRPFIAKVPEKTAMIF